MTVNASAGYRKDYTGNGSTTLFPVPFYFLDASHLQVILTDLTTLIPVDLVLNSDYTVAGAGFSSGGSITTTATYSNNYRLTILRSVPLEQQTHYVDGDPFPAESHEEALDKLTMIVQQQAEVLNRAVTGNAGSTASYALPAAQPGYALGWDAAGKAIVNCPNTAASQTALIQSSQQQQSYTTATTGGTTPNFTAAISPAITSYIDGLEVELKFHTDGVLGSSTLNINGLGPVSLRQYAADGSKIPADVRSGMITRVRYDGTDMVVLNPLPSGLGLMTGAIIHVSQSSAPTGTLKADGSAVSRTTYSRLFAVIGTLFGAGDGSTTFNLPDLRGEFLRGWDDGRGVDGARVLGSTQGDAIRNITGTFARGGIDTAFGAFSNGGEFSGAGSNPQRNFYAKFDASSVVPTAAENRPRNVALLACIVY